jgi:hypothetical protein
MCKLYRIEYINALFLNLFYFKNNQSDGKVMINQHNKINYSVLKLQCSHAISPNTVTLNWICRHVMFNLVTSKQTPRM